MSQRVIAYIDGFNLYFGIRTMRWSQYYWLDIPKAVNRLMGPRRRLLATKYFTARITDDPGKAKRQTDYLEALHAQPGVQLFFGVYQTHARTCRECGAVSAYHNEKMTDVNIAVEMMSDAHRDLFDVAVLVSADSDLAPVIAAVRTLFPSKIVQAMFPPARGSVRLEALAHEKRRIRQGILAESQLAETVVGLNGTELRRPREWMLPPNDDWGAGP